jgi:hypothetical protein
MGTSVPSRPVLDGPASPLAAVAQRLGDAVHGYGVLAVDALGIDPEQDFAALDADEQFPVRPLSIDRHLHALYFLFAILA